MTITRISFFVFALVSTIFITSPSRADMVMGQGVFESPAILDNGGDVVSTINITDAGFIQDIRVTILGIQHTNVGDLVAELRYLGPGGPSGPGGQPAYLFFRPNVDMTNTLGSRGNLDGNYTFTTDPSDANFWSETAIPDDETVNDELDYFASDINGDFHDLSGPNFFGGFNTVGEWQLVIRDDNSFGLNEGSVEGWNIKFVVTPIPEPSAALVGALAVLIGFRRSR